MRPCITKFTQINRPMKTKMLIVAVVMVVLDRFSIVVKVVDNLVNDFSMNEAVIAPAAVKLKKAMRPSKILITPIVILLVSMYLHPSMDIIAGAAKGCQWNA